MNCEEVHSARDAELKNELGKLNFFCCCSFYLENIKSKILLQCQDVSIWIQSTPRVGMFLHLNVHCWWSF